ncbi:MAG: hypothetical protein JXA69_15830 [Phycisphaerae bacterium]|nr:hypothetical protein [Phycisphaerae bacterium]
MQHEPATPATESTGGGAGWSGPASCPAEIEGPGRTLLRTIAGRWWVLLLSMAAFCAAASLYATRATPIYASAAKLRVEQELPHLVSDVIDISRRHDHYMGTQIEVLRSRPLLGAVVSQPEIQAMATLHGIADPAGFLKSALECSVGDKNDIINVSIKSPHREDTARIVNAVTAAYLEFHSNRTRDTAAELLDILQNAKRTGSVELAAAMDKVLAFKRANGVLFLEDERGNIITQRLARLSAELTSAEIETIQAQTAFEAAAAIRDRPQQVIQMLRTAGNESLSWHLEQENVDSRTQLAELELKHRALLESYSPTFPLVKRTESAVAAARTQAEENDRILADLLLSALEQRAAGCRAREDQIRAAVDEQKVQAMDFNAKAIEYDMLRTELERQQRMCDILESRIKEINITENVGGLNISVLEPAQIPTMPIYPRKRQIVSLAAILGLLTGLGLIVAWQWWFGSTPAVAEMSNLLALPLLGNVPPTTGTSLHGRMDLAACDGVSSEASVAYRAIRTALDARAPEGTARTVLVTSPTDEDASAVAGRLAVTMAETGKRILLIDANLRHPRQHDRFGVERSPGLHGLLSSDTPFSAAIKSTGIAGLDLLPAGAVVPAMSGPLGSGLLGHLLELLAFRYDAILVDSPDVLGGTDTCTIGAYCDKIILVIKQHATSGEHAVRARNALATVGGNILGFVLCDAQESKRNTPFRQPATAAV